MFAVAIIFIAIFVMATIGTVRANMQYKKATQSVTRYQQWATPTTYYHYHSNTRDEYVAMRGDAGLVNPGEFALMVCAVLTGTLFAYAMAYLCAAVWYAMRDAHARMVRRGTMRGDRGAVDVSALAHAAYVQYWDVYYKAQSLAKEGYVEVHDNGDTLVMEKYIPAEPGYHGPFKAVVHMQRTTTPWFSYAFTSVEEEG